MNGGTNRYMLLYETNAIHLGYNGVGANQGGSSANFTSYTYGTLMHIVIVIPSNGNALAYVNGSVIATPLTTVPISPNATFTNVTTNLFNFNGTGGNASGYINNFYIFTRALSAQEVTALYNQ